MRILPICQKFNISFVFPWAVENFSEYLDYSSIWLQEPELVYDEFKNIFGEILSANFVSDLSRSI
jgi:hypothetical protein